jgi:outer membrane biosynthesis protein TonB
MLGCATASPAPPVQVIQDCPAAVAAEKERAAKEGRSPLPIVQRGELLTDILDPDNRPTVTFAIFTAARGAPLQAVLKIFVAADGRVARVDFYKTSGVPLFDEALAAKVKTWRHRPSMVNCQPVPYIYPMNYVHRTGR